MLVDSHANLHAEAFAEDLNSVIGNAREAGVAYMLTISDKLSSIDAIKAISAEHEFIWRSVGVHPHYAADYKDLTAAKLIELSTDADVVGIGECGLDFHYEYSDRAVQIPVFEEHITASQETHLPLIIHTRNADDETQSLLTRRFNEREFPPLLHCYTGEKPLAEAVLDIGGYISFSGIITFKNAGDLRDLVRWAPMDRIIVETDCPYLAPVPMRGRRCEPAHVAYVAEKVAELKGVTAEKIASVTTGNFFRLFSRAKRDETSS